MAHEVTVVTLGQREQVARLAREKLGADTVEEVSARGENEEQLRENSRTTNTETCDNLSSQREGHEFVVASGSILAHPIQDDLVAAVVLENLLHSCLTDGLLHVLQDGEALHGELKEVDLLDHSLPRPTLQAIEHQALPTCSRYGAAALRLTNIHAALGSSRCRVAVGQECEKRDRCESCAGFLVS